MNNYFIMNIYSFQKMKKKIHMTFYFLVKQKSKRPIKKPGMAKATTMLIRLAKTQITEGCYTCTLPPPFTIKKLILSRKCEQRENERKNFSISPCYHPYLHIIYTQPAQITNPTPYLPFSFSFSLSLSLSFFLLCFLFFFFYYYYLFLG
jgi:hypothetical protein